MKARELANEILLRFLYSKSRRKATSRRCFFIISSFKISFFSQFIFIENLIVRVFEREREIVVRKSVKGSSLFIVK